MKPTITFLMSSAGTTYGGSETYVINIAKQLCHDFNIKLILGRGRFTDDFNALIKKYPVEFLSVPFISRHSKFSTLLRKTSIYKKINDFDIEALTVMASIKKINRFLSDTDILEVQYPTESLIFPFVRKDIKKIIHFHGPWPPPLYMHTKKGINRYTDASITNSYWSKTILEQKTHIKNIEVIYNGIDTELFKPIANNEFNVNVNYNPNLPRFGTVGRLSKAKGTDLLIHVALDLEGMAEFFAVGPYEKELMTEIEYKKISNFHLLGSLPNNALSSFYNFIDCFVLPSLFEAFGITLIEAMSCGRPVIASNVGGIPEIIDNGLNGILVKPGDYVSLKESIVTILNSKDGLNNLGKLARKKVVEIFSIEKTLNRLKEYYKGLIN